MRTYINGVNTAFRTGDTSAAKSASSPDCKCRDQLTEIARVYAQHAHFAGTHLATGRLVVTKREPTTAQVRLTVRVPASQVVLPNGKRRHLKAFPPRTVTATVVDEDGRWVVTSFTGLPRPEVTNSPTPMPSG